MTRTISTITDPNAFVAVLSYEGNDFTPYHFSVPSGSIFAAKDKVRDMLGSDANSPVSVNVIRLAQYEMEYEGSGYPFCDFCNTHSSFRVSIDVTPSAEPVRRSHEKYMCTPCFDIRNYRLHEMYFRHDGMPVVSAR